MTIETSASSVTYTGNGATTDFDYSFLIPDADSAVVSLTTIADNTTEELDPSLFSITGLDDPNGGTVTYPLAGSPLSSAYRLTVQRILPLTQEVDLTNQDGFYPQVLEGALDAAVMQIQQLQEEIDRAVIFPVGTETDVPALIAAILAGSANAAAAAASAAAAAASAATVAAALPVGLEAVWPLTAPPTGWLVENGQVVSQATYAALFAKLGTTYNTGGEGAGNFRLPNKQDRVVQGKSGSTTIGQTLGSASQTLITANLPAYTPAGTNATSSVSVTTALNVLNLTSGAPAGDLAVGATVLAQNNPVSAGTAAAQVFTGTAQGGTATAFSILQPTIVQQWIIWSGVI